MSEADRPISPGWLRALGLFAVASLVTVYTWWTMIAAYPKTPEEDGRYVYHQFEVAKAAIKTYHELPLWNPFDCRGIPMWDHPEAMIASPIIWLFPGISTTTTVIIWNLVHVIAGFIGMWLLVRHELALSRRAAFVGSTLFALGVCHVSQYAGEHETFVTFLFAPILILLWRRAERDLAYAVGLAIVLALMVYEGATYPLPYSGAMLAIETLTRLTSRERAIAIVKAGVVAVVLAVMLSASRLLPLMDQMRSHSRGLSQDLDGIKKETLWAMYTLRSPNWRAPIGQVYVFGEYITYISWLGVVLLVVGIIAAGGEYVWLLFLGAVLALLMMGNFGDHSPWALLNKYVPPFKSMRVAARFRLLEMMVISAFIASAIDWVPKRLRMFGLGPRIVDATGVALFGLALVVAGDAIGLDQEILTFRFNGPPAQAVSRATRFHYGGPGLAEFIDQPRQNRAWLGCRSYEWPSFRDAPLWTGDVPQAKAADDGAVVEVANRTHNTFTIDVTATRSSTIILNSAYERSWQSDVGQVVNHETMLAIEVPPGHHRIHARYWPRTLTPGFISSGVGLAIVVGFFMRRRRSLT
jgi:hypothetical protein